MVDVRLSFTVGGTPPVHYMEIIESPPLPHEQMQGLAYQLYETLSNGVEIWRHDITIPGDRMPLPPLKERERSSTGRRVRMEYFGAPIIHMRTPPRFNRIIEVATSDYIDGQTLEGYNYREHFWVEGDGEEVHGGDPNINRAQWIEKLSSI